MPKRGVRACGGTVSMALFFRISLVYFIAAIGLVAVVRDDLVTLVMGAWLSTVNVAPRLVLATVCVALLSLTVMYFVRKTAFKDTGVAIGFAFAGTLFFHMGFGLVKTTIPYLVPFYADPIFAEMDRVLHGGVDPWVWVYGWSDVIPYGRILDLYMGVWWVPAICFAVLIAAVDRDAARVQRFVLLYVIAWVVCGNVLALMGSSVGPVYYDRIYGGDRFAALEAAMAAGALDGHLIAQIQEWLWRVYAEHGQAVGSGISAFPSVHVSVSTVIALYLWERSRWLAPVGIVFLALIQLLSVYTGYHYAIDGYASMIVVGLVWGLLRRRDGATGAAASDLKAATV